MPTTPLILVGHPFTNVVSRGMPDGAIAETEAPQGPLAAHVPSLQEHDHFLQLQASMQRRSNWIIANCKIWSMTGFGLTALGIGGIAADFILAPPIGAATAISIASGLAGISGAITAVYKIKTASEERTNHPINQARLLAAYRSGRIAELLKGPPPPPRPPEWITVEIPEWPEHSARSASSENVEPSPELDQSAATASSTSANPADLTQVVAHPADSTPSPSSHS